MDFNGLCLPAGGDFVKRVLVRCEDLFGPWIGSKLGFEWFSGRGQIIGLMDERQGPVAAALFEGCNGASISVHLASAHRQWLNREFLWFVCYYPFEQLKVHKVIAPIESSNSDSIRWTEHFGFTLEATLKDAAPKGDLLIYTITRDQCKWLALKDRNSEQTKSPRSS